MFVSLIFSYFSQQWIQTFIYECTVKPGFIRTSRGHAKCSYYSGARIKRTLRKNLNDTCFIDTKTKADISRQKSVVWFLYCNFISSNLIYHSLGLKLLYLLFLNWRQRNRSPISISLRAAGDAESHKQRTSKRKKATSNDCSKRPRKCLCSKSK